jgi:hypothetical protein
MLGAIPTSQQVITPDWFQYYLRFDCYQVVDSNWTLPEVCSAVSKIGACAQEPLWDRLFSAPSQIQVRRSIANFRPKAIKMAPADRESHFSKLGRSRSQSERRPADRPTHAMRRKVKRANTNPRTNTDASGRTVPVRRIAAKTRKRISRFLG